MFIIVLSISITECFCDTYATACDGKCYSDSLCPVPNSPDRLYWDSLLWYDIPHLSEPLVEKRKPEVAMPLILIADDEPGYHALIRKILTNPAYAFIEAKDGRQALTAARAYHP